MQEAKIVPESLATLTGVLTESQAARFEAAAVRARDVLDGRIVWNVSSTATGGGVAEMLHSLLGYVSGAGVKTRWLVIHGDPEFFSITKRLHNGIHGAGSPDALGPADHAHYERTLAANLPELLPLIGPRDVVLLHDPQPAGLVEPLRQAGIPVIWRSHIGRDIPNESSVAAWEFLRGYVESADAYVFSRERYAPAWLARDRLTVIPPSIDPLSEKNRPMSPDECRDILVRAGLLAGGPARAGVVAGAPAPDPDTRLVVQVSRWDRLKDMPGVMTGFSRMTPAVPDAHLMLVGPAVSGVSDDPEGAEVYAECLAIWRELPEPDRDRVHLVSVPMEDQDENARIINAVQRHATVVTQKSLAEGFGLTVAEAMWKARPVVASAVGGIQDQIVDGRDGLLLPDPYDLDAFCSAVRSLLVDESLAARLGAAARRRVHEQFLGDRHLVQYAELFAAVVDGQ
jgi:trehalose synthase